MSVQVNNRPLRAAFSEDSAVSTVSPQALQALSLTDDEKGRVFLPVTVSAEDSPQICSCIVECVVSSPFFHVDLVLGRDWYEQSSHILAARCVRFENMTLKFPTYDRKRSEKRAHAGVMPSVISYQLPAESSSSKTSPCIQRCPAFEILCNVFCRDYNSGARTSVFCDSMASLRHAMQLHGIQSDGMSLTSCQDALMRHYISGNCFDNTVRAKGDRQSHSLKSSIDVGLLC